MNTIKLLADRLFCDVPRQGRIWQKRYVSSISEEIKRQSGLFDLEKKRQWEDIGRIEKIEVTCDLANESTVLIMNRNLSTPYDCARHLGEKYVHKSAVALLNGDTLWHMHKPIPDNCKLEFLHYFIPQPSAVNKAFWRTCSFLLGAVANEAFKENVQVLLHSFPSPNVKSGSFVYDIQLSLDDWKPTEQELRILSIEMIKFTQKNYNIECLDVSPEFALLLFENNPHKKQQIPDIASHNNGKVTLFKAGDHVDISRGPMVTNTNHLGRITISNVHKLDTDIVGGPIYRFQGVALPSAIVVNHFAYGLLEERAKKLNSARVPGSSSTLSEDNTFISSAVA